MKYFYFLIVFLAPVLANSQQSDTGTLITVKDSIFTNVEKEASFPGGVAGWQKYLEHNLKASLAAKYIPLKRKERFAQQRIKVQFIVNKDGKILNVKTINPEEVHPKLAKEAERVIKAGPDWVPAEQNGKKVIYQAIQHISFQVARE